MMTTMTMMMTMTMMILTMTMMILTMPTCARATPCSPLHPPSRNQRCRGRLISIINNTIDITLVMVVIMM